jgi:hypothetical protein
MNKSKFVWQIAIASIICVLSVSAIVSATTTVGTGLTTNGTLTAYGPVFIGGALTATSTASFDEDVNLGNATSDTIWSKGNLTASGTLQLAGNGTFYSTITVNGVTGLTDADIPNTITASNYLPLIGGELSGNFTTTGSIGIGTTSPQASIEIAKNITGSNVDDGLILNNTSGSLSPAIHFKNTTFPNSQSRLYTYAYEMTFEGTTNNGSSWSNVFKMAPGYSNINSSFLSIGTTTESDAKLAVSGSTIIGNTYDYITATPLSSGLLVKGSVGIGTTTPWGSKLDLYGDMIISGNSRYLNFGATNGSSGYGFFDNNGTLQYKNSGGSWANLGSGGSSQWTTSVSDINFATGKVSIGTTTTNKLLTIAGSDTNYGNIVSEGDNLPGYLISNLSATTDYKNWSMYADSLNGLYFTTLNDSMTSGNLWLKVTRSGTNINDIKFLNGNLSVNGKATTTASNGNIATEGSMTIGNGGTAIAKHLSTTGTVGNAGAAVTLGSCASSTITVTGAASGDSVVATPPSAIEDYFVWSAYVSAPDTVKVRLCNPTGGSLNSADLTWRIDVWKH